MNITPGMSVCTLCGELDTDNEGNDRKTPKGTWGWISAHNHDDHWDVVFPNGAWVVLSEEELRDPKQYTLGAPSGLKQACLRMQYGYEVEQLSMLDDDMISCAQDICDEVKQILHLLDKVELLEDELAESEAENTKLRDQIKRMAAYSRGED